MAIKLHDIIQPLKQLEIKTYFDIQKLKYNRRAQQEAMDIFGVNAEELGAVSDEDDLDNDEDDEEDLDEDAEDLIEDDDEQMDEDDDPTKNFTKKRQRQRRLKALHKIEDIFEPRELEKGLITEVDQQIRLEDKPERFMLRSIPVTSEPDEAELEKEAEWIFNQVFIRKPTVLPKKQTNFCILHLSNNRNIYRISKN